MNNQRTPLPRKLSKRLPGPSLAPPPRSAGSCPGWVSRLFQGSRMRAVTTAWRISGQVSARRSSRVVPETSSAGHSLNGGRAVSEERRCSTVTRLSYPTQGQTIMVLPQIWNKTCECKAPGWHRMLESLSRAAFLRLAGRLAGRLGASPLRRCSLSCSS